MRRQFLQSLAAGALMLGIGIGGALAQDDYPSKPITLILPLGAWVMRKSCEAARQMRDAGRPVRIAVNVSSRQLYNYDLKGLVRRSLEEFALPAECLELEVTERLHPPLPGAHHQDRPGIRA